MDPAKIDDQHQLQKNKHTTWFYQNTNEMHHHKVEELHERMDEECERILNENKKKEPSDWSKAVDTISNMATGAAAAATTGIALTSAIPSTGAHIAGAIIGGLFGGFTSLLKRK